MSEKQTLEPEKVPANNLRDLIQPTLIGSKESSANETLFQKHHQPNTHVNQVSRNEKQNTPDN